MRSTVIAPNAWAADCLRLESARERRIGARVLPIEFAVARLAGGFLQPFDRIVVLDAIRAAVADACPAEFEAARDLPGFVRAATSSLMKAWSVGIDLVARGAGSPRIASMAALEADVLKRLPLSMRRPVELRTLALKHLDHAPSVLGSVRIVGRTEMSPVWRPFLMELKKVVPVTWVAGGRPVPEWVPGQLEVERSEPAAARTYVYSCADGAHEGLEALRWAKDLISTGRAKPEEIAICAAAPQAFDAEIAAIADSCALPIHFIHGRPAVEGREGQEAAALADILLSGLSLQRFRRLGLLTQGSAFAQLPEDWNRILPRDASLTSLDRWRVLLDKVDGWPGGVSFADRLLEILALLAGGPAAAQEAGQKLLGAKARALWERGLLEGPAAALLTTLGALGLKDEVEGLTSIVWGPAEAVASYPRPFVRMIGLNAGSWPRGISEDPLLPGHVIPESELDPLPVADADRRDFETILACASGEVAISRSRRGADGRLLGASPLFPVALEIELTKARAPERAVSRGDLLAARPQEFLNSSAGAAARKTWRDWHVPQVTAHDGRVRPDHPVILQALARPMSASTVKALLTNPIGWMFKEVFSLSEPEAEEEPFELNALAFGNLVHRIIEVAAQDLERAGGPSKASEAEVSAACARAAIEIAREFELEQPVPPARVWRLTVARAVDFAEAALFPSFFTPLPGQKSWAEVPFGKTDANPVGLPWNPHSEVRIGGILISGKVDRLDLSDDNRQARVIDWKTGKVPGGVAEVIGGGSEVQRPIYAAAVRQLLAVEQVEAGLALLKDGGGWKPVADADESLELLTRRLNDMRQAAARGLLLPGPAAEDKYDDFSFALPGDAKERYLRDKKPSVRAALGEAAAVWDDP